MPPSAWTFYEKFIEKMGEKYHDLESDEIKLALFQNTSDCADITKQDYSTLSDEVAAAYGYTTGGEILTGPSFSETGGITTFDCTGDALWTAGPGGPIIFRWMVLYNNTAASDDLIAFALGNALGVDVSVPDGGKLTIKIDPLGIFTVEEKP